MTDASAAAASPAVPPVHRPPVQGKAHATPPAPQEPQLPLPPPAPQPLAQAVAGPEPQAHGPQPPPSPALVQVREPQARGVGPAFPFSGRSAPRPPILRARGVLEERAAQAVTRRLVGFVRRGRKDLAMRAAEALVALGVLCDEGVPTVPPPKGVAVRRRWSPGGDAGAEPFAFRVPTGGGSGDEPAGGAAGGPVA